MSGQMSFSTAWALKKVRYSVFKKTVWRCATIASSVAVLIGSVACGNDTAGPGLGDAAKRFWTIELNHYAVTLSTHAPYDTLRIVAIPRTTDGTALTNGTVSFRVGDGNDTTVFVSPTGLLTGHAPNSGTRVLVSITQGGLTLTDTVLVQVNTTVPASSSNPLQTFSIHPSGGGNLTVECSLDVALPVTTTIVDAVGNTLSGVPVYYSSADPMIADPSHVTGTGAHVGTSFENLLYPNCTGAQIGTPVWIRATTTVYGVTYTDSVQFTATVPALGFTALIPGTASDGSPTLDNFVPNLTIAAGGVVIWYFYGAEQATLDVVFDKPDQVAMVTGSVSDCCGVLVPGDAAGNITGWAVDPNVPYFLPPNENGYQGLNPEWATINARVRRFPATGRYTYHSPQYPKFTGVIDVIATAGTRGP